MVVSDIRRPMKLPGEGMNFEFACEQVEYWHKMVDRVRDGHYGEEGKEHREAYAIAALTEWLNIKEIMCGCHKAEFVAYDGKGHELLRCKTCGAHEIRDTVVGTR